MRQRSRQISGLLADRFKAVLFMLQDYVSLVQAGLSFSCASTNLGQTNAILRYMPLGLSQPRFAGYLRL